MADKLYVSEYKAKLILMRDGDFTDAQADIVLNHSLKQSYDNSNYYPLDYINKRARENHARV